MTLRTMKLKCILILLGTLWCMMRAFSASPNIVMIVSDDHAWTDYGFMGHPQIKTPHLDKLAGESLTFRHGYVTSSLCCPSLATLLTGQYPHQHGITSNDPPLVAGDSHKSGAAMLTDPTYIAGRERMNVLMDAAPALPRLLRDRGYLTMQTGKWWQGHFSRGGFTHGMTKGMRHGDSGLEIGRKTMQPAYDFIAMAGEQKKPFFLWYAPMMPHDPHTPPERILAKYRNSSTTIHIARYQAMVEWFDETCGAMLNHLDEKKLRNDTIVVYLADNGWIQNPDNTRYAPKSKQSPYDGGLRTPIILRWPRHITPRQLEVAVSSIDIAPTILRAVGSTPDPSMRGLNLLDSEALKSRSAIFGGCFAHTSVNLSSPAASLRWRWCRAGDWKLMLPGALEPDARPELYDLAHDPTELKNLASEMTDKVSSMQAHIDGWWIAK